MAFLKLDTHEGVQDAFNAALEGGLGWDSFKLDTTYAYSPTGQRFTNLSYDPAGDRLIVTRGEFVDWALKVGFSHFYYPTIGPIYPPTWMHVSFTGESLDPSGPLATQGASTHWYPNEGCCMGLTRDPNTGALSQSTCDLFTMAEANETSYGKAMLVALSTIDSGRVTWTVDSVTGEIATDDVTILNDPFAYQVTVHSLLFTTFGGHIGKVEAGGTGHPTPNVLTFDDIAVVLYEDDYHQAFLSVVQRGSKQWRGTRQLYLGHAMALCALGPDRGMAICWQTPDDTSPLVAATFTYDRSAQQLIIESVETLLQTHTYDPHWQVNFATYDANRQAVVLLTPDEASVERYVTQNLCHPGRPTSAFDPVPLSAVHEDRVVTWAVYTGTETTPVPQPTVYLSYGAASNVVFSGIPPAQVQTGPLGTGTFTINYSSAAEGGTMPLTAYLSSYSVGLSSVTEYGDRYGNEHMGVITATNTFAVSAGLSAAISATILVAAATILPGRPALQSDAVGAGTPQELSYPGGALASPLVFELNPQQWTNMAADALTRPLYAAQRTLTKTANVQFVGHMTDLEVRLIWMGGGDRAAMSWTFFSQLYNYYANTPDVLTDGYLTWSPKDLNNHVYAILFTNLEAGGQQVIQLDTLAKAGDGLVHDPVTATFRLIAQLV